MSNSHGPHDAAVKMKQLERRVLVAGYIKKGKSKGWIRRKLEVSVNTIYHDQRAILKEWHETFQDDIKAGKTMAIARVMHVFEEAYDAWEKSKEPKVSTTEDIKQTPSGKNDKPDRTTIRAMTKKEEGPGDPAFLAVLTRCNDQIIEILGIKAPRPTPAGSLELAPICDAFMATMRMVRAQYGIEREAIEAATRTFAGIITQQASGGALIDVQPALEVDGLEVDGGEGPNANGANGHGPGENGDKPPGP